MRRIIFCIAFSFALASCFRQADSPTPLAGNVETKTTWKDVVEELNLIEEGDRAFSHSTYNGRVYNHKNYFLSYSENDEQAEWVAYELTKEEVNNTSAKKQDMFSEDPMIVTKSASPNDYKNTGYDKGHLAPSGDMRFNEDAQRECFYMSNMSPQIHKFNAGIWNDLEHYARKRARKTGSLYIVTGPILKNCNKKLTKRYKSGEEKETRVTLPDYFYKILFDYRNASRPRMIAFVMPNAEEVEYNDIFKYATTVRRVEKLTGINFFKNLSTEAQNKLENECNVDMWR